MKSKLWNKVHTLNFKTTLHIGPGAINKINEALISLKLKGISRLLIVTSKNAYKKSGAWEHVLHEMVELGLQWQHYDKVLPNPTDTQVNEASLLGQKIDAEAVIGIGGGSAIDTAKGAAILLKYKEKQARDIYYHNFSPTTAVPIIAINTTHGTGTEVDRFAVATMPDKKHKLGMGFPFTYPMVGIDDPNLMATLPKEQALYTTIDALSHAYESATTKITTPYSILLAQETFKLAAIFLPKIINDPKDLEARYFLTYGSAMAGIAFDIGALHIVHALEHPLSSHEPNIAHGLGLGMLLPAVIRRVYKATPEVSHSLLSHMIKGLRPIPQDADKAATGFEVWMRNLGLTQKLKHFGFNEQSLLKLASFAWGVPSHRSLMSLAPIQMNPDVVRKVYLESLEPFTDEKM